MLWGLRLEANKIRDHVESVIYDHRDQSVRAKVIPPPEPEPDADSAEAEAPARKRKRRDAFNPDR